MTILNKVVSSILVAVVLLTCSVILLSAKWNKKPPTIQPTIILEAHSPEFQEAFYQASRIYGKAGCGDQKLSEMTAKAAVDSELPGSLIAAQIAVESTCNPFAISNQGAIGLMQIRPKAWSRQYDFTKINLLNPEDNMKTGTGILSALIKQYGVKSALVRYYGTGSDDIGLGGTGYAEKVYQMAGVK